MPRCGNPVDAEPSCHSACACTVRCRCAGWQKLPRLALRSDADGGDCRVEAQCPSLPCKPDHGWFAVSDTDFVERGIENPYWQHFSGERYFRYDLPCDPSSLARWHQSCARMGRAAEAQAGRHAHVQQRRRMRREFKWLRTWLGRVLRA